MHFQITVFLLAGYVNCIYRFVSIQNKYGSHNGNINTTVESSQEECMMDSR